MERALRRRPVAEVRDRDPVLALQRRPPRVADGVRYVRRDRDADRRDAVLLRVPPARRMAAPPGEDGRDGHPAQEPDRRLAVAREDPVALLERERRAGLHRLVVPEDRVRPDAALAVVHDRALVVRPQEHEVAIEREQLVAAESVHLAVRDGRAVTDHATQAPIRRQHQAHGALSVFSAARSPVRARGHDLRSDPRRRSGRDVGLDRDPFVLTPEHLDVLRWDVHFPSERGERDLHRVAVVVRAPSRCLAHDARSRVRVDLRDEVPRRREGDAPGQENETPRLVHDAAAQGVQQRVVRRVVPAPVEPDIHDHAPHLRARARFRSAAANLPSTPSCASRRRRRPARAGAWRTTASCARSGARAESGRRAEGAAPRRAGSDPSRPARRASGGGPRALAVRALERQPTSLALDEIPSP